MGLIRNILTRAEYDQRIDELSKDRAYLRDEASSIGVPPGWLSIVEKLVNRIHVISKGKIAFVIAEKAGTYDSLTVFVETPIKSETARHQAIMNEVKKAQTFIQLGSICKYCGVELNDIERKTGDYACSEHERIASGWYQDDIKYEAPAQDEELIEMHGGLYVQPDPAGLALDILNSTLSPMMKTNPDAARHLENGITLVTKFRLRTRTMLQSEFNEEKTQILDGLEEALKEKEAKKPVIVDTTGREYPTVQMYKMEDVEAMWAKSQWRDRKQLIEPYFKAMKEKGVDRHFAIASESWSEDLDALALDFPNFEEVIGFLRQQFALAAMGDGRVHFPPLLLNGPAGVGKTFLAKTLAGMIRTTYAEIHMESEQNGSSITGASAFWANALPGKVADALILHDAANPVIVVDELDKAITRSQYDPLAGLYGLLEPSTAKSFEDQCLCVPMNASAICWVFTSNELDRIPQPIMSRLRVFTVPAPTVDQVKHIARRIYASLLKSHWGKAFVPELPADVIEALGKREPRVIRNALLSALGNAAIHQRSTLVVSDLDGTLQSASGGDYQDTKIGFAKDMK